MMNGINTRGTGNTHLSHQMQRNTTKDETGLTYREREMLGKIRNMIGSPVKLNLGVQNESGFTLAETGFWPTPENSTRPPFLITQNILAEMAECEQKFNEHMIWIQRAIQQQAYLENSFGNVRSKVGTDPSQVEAERRSHQIRLSMMAALDFWNVNQR